MSKQKKKHDKNDKMRNDITRFVNKEATKFDPSGSYTGVPNEVFYNNVDENPIQDADDL